MSVRPASQIVDMPGGAGGFACVPNWSVCPLRDGANDERIFRLDVFEKTGNRVLRILWGPAGHLSGGRQARMPAPRTGAINGLRTRR